jgi:hypothetical protein
LRSIADALGLTTEQLLAKAGWAQAVADDIPTEQPVGTEDSIRRDPLLTEAQRTALLGVYRSFIEGRTR